jgi:hypothetical protein
MEVVRMNVHPRSDNLKLALEYPDWEILDTCLRTLTVALIRKDRRGEARRMRKMAAEVSDILSELRKEGHV